MNGVVTLSGSKVTLTSNFGGIILNKDVTGNQDFTLNADEGTVYVETIGQTAGSAVGDVDINADAAEFAGDITAATLDTEGVGLTTLTRDVEVTATGVKGVDNTAIILGATDGANDLTLWADDTLDALITVTDLNIRELTVDNTYDMEFDGYAVTAAGVTVDLATNDVTLVDGNAIISGGNVTLIANNNVLINGDIVVNGNSAITLNADADDAGPAGNQGKVIIGAGVSGASATLEASIGAAGLRDADKDGVLEGYMLAVEIIGYDVILDQATVITTGGGDVFIAVNDGAYIDTAASVYHVTGSVIIDPPTDPGEHSSQAGSAAVDWFDPWENNANFNEGADIIGNDVTIISDLTPGVDEGHLAPDVHFGDIVFSGDEVTANGGPVLTGANSVTLDSNMGSIYSTVDGLIVSGGNAEFSGQLLGTLPTLVDVPHSIPPANPSDPVGIAVDTITATALNVNIADELVLNAENMVQGISGVLQGTAGALTINPDTPGMIIWNGFYIDHAGPLAVAYAQALSTVSPYGVNEQAGVEDLRLGSKYYGDGVPYEGRVMDNRSRFDVLNGAVFVPYPDLIQDLRLMKPCEDE